MLITDVQLAGHQSGVELARYARHMFPKMKVIMVSGQNVEQVPDGVAFVRKPFAPDALAALAIS